MNAKNGQVQALSQAQAAVRAITDRTPRVAMVLGSGLGALAEDLSDRVVIPYDKIPGIPQSRVVGHAGNLVFGTAEGVEVVAMQGRAHLYEGHSAAEIVFGTRLMIRLGADTLVITNAAGGANPDYEPGDLMGIDDHLNLTGTNCLLGANEDELGPRFPDMSVAYDRGLLEVAERSATAKGYKLRRGVYAGLLGPTYETPAEVRMCQGMGADAVGMSTVLEVIAARHMGARVLGISCITNKAAGLSDELLSHDEVKDTATRVKSRFIELIRSILSEIGNE